MAGYIGVGGVARKIKNMYIGVSGVARKVKKAYIGVGGVARLWYSAETSVDKQGNATALSMATDALDHANVGNYVIISPSENDNSAYSRDIYNSSLTKTTISKARYTGSFGAASTPSYAICSARFKGDCYNASLTATQITLGSGNPYSSAASTGDYCLFLSNSPSVITVNNSLTVGNTTGTGIPGAHDGSSVQSTSGTSFHDNAVFAGSAYDDGDDYNYSSMAVRYNSSLTKSSMTNLNSAGGCYGIASSENYLIYSNDGGYFTYSTMDNYTSYSTSFTKGTPIKRTHPTQTEYGLTNTIGCGFKDICVFVGGTYGRTWSYSVTNVDKYDSSLTKSALTALGEKTSWADYTKSRGANNIKVGNYMLFAGGNNTSGTKLSKVEVYKIS